MHTLKTLLLAALTLSSTLTLTTATSTSTPTYSITEPTSGAIISLNTATVISWNTTAPSTSKLSIHLSKTTNDTNLYTIASNISNSGSISWSPPSRVGTGSDYIVVLEPSDSSESYKSDAFTISSSTNASTTYYPTQGEVVKTGQTTIITWEVERNVSEVSIYLMEGTLNGNGTGNGTGLKNVTTITTDIANSGDVACVLPGSVKSGDDYRFAIVDVKDVGKVKYSAVFEVVNSGDDSSSSSSSDEGAGSGEGSTSSSGSSSSGSGSAAGNGKATSGAARVSWIWGSMGWGVVGLVIGSLVY
ncbi:major facilitator superfamily protein [Aspergillus niger]|uniref:uncharacterized protein n=1 Tax=Aspergillus lacticoffeatus (strain CBS 101883) TaxID=1450533 RepID=UPI000D7FB7E0|nr:uncharacterized protein BO96DRAFT_459377 [Aspergillus niger CBS 101883]KAI2901336.1 hypothetical protein CBS11852_2735 [Aspergillus niger]KAI3007401.1 hypothetical protein CBS147346_3210 [Aspergillus niger]KAI3056387.1 hypothetical protein CBS147352_2467 [Aspergillus niger]PYH52745.1 hypothetical protein BO96DRAFT_459377 [Aspergillus niger CBS 101883]GJP88718.1 major facilitator superfamily protein [Aspergillus niger]